LNYRVDSRNVYTFLYLDPNVTQSAADGSFKFIGAQSYGASFSLDGQRSNGGIFAKPTASQPSLEAVGEINLLTSDFSAEYAGVANVRVSTKRGGSLAITAQRFTTTRTRRWLPGRWMTKTTWQIFRLIPSNPNIPIHILT